jgi:putative transposase
MRRRFVADEPNRMWVTDITQHPTREGWVYCAVVLDAFARRVVGHTIADHLRTELVVDALETTRWRRHPPAGQTVVHSDRGTQYTSWAFSHRLHAAGCPGRRPGRHRLGQRPRGKLLRLHADRAP